MTEKTVFYLSDDPDNGISLPIEGELKSNSYVNKEGITKSNLVRVEIGTNVTTIGENAFLNCSKLQSVTIPDSVKTIGRSAFNGCRVLESVTIGNSVETIGDYAFYTCMKLKLLTIPNSVKSIGSHAFSTCRKLQSVTIGNSVTSIGERAFEYCGVLKSVTIGDSVKSIGASAFHSCGSLQSVTIPDSVTSIGYSVFQSCITLKSVTIGNSVTSIGSSAFQYCRALQSVTIGDSVTSIGSSAFADCEDLQSLTIPDSVTSIGEFAFKGSSLSVIRMSSLKAKTLRLIPNKKQEVGGEKSVFVECPSAFIQPGIISGSETTFDDWSSTDVKIALRYYKPTLRTFEQSREGLLIADLTKIAAEGASITEIKWFKKNTNDDNYIVQERATKFERTYPYKKEDVVKVQCTYSVNDKEESNPTTKTVESNPTITDQTNVDNYFEFDGLSFFNKIFTVTVEQNNNENKYVIDDVQQKQLSFYKGSSYTFISDNFTSHPLKFSTTEDGTNSTGGVEYTTGVYNGTTGDDKKFVEITIDQNTPSTLYYYCENHANMGGKINIRYENPFLNAEFRKTLTKVYLSTITSTLTTISNTDLFENDSFYYENMQEVEVGNKITSITGTPFPKNTRYYIDSVNKYLDPNTYPWVNDTNKQLYFYLSESDRLAKTRSDDGVDINLLQTLFVYNQSLDENEKLDDVEYRYITNTKYDNNIGEIFDGKIKYFVKEDQNTGGHIQVRTNIYGNNEYVGGIASAGDSYDKSYYMKYTVTERRPCDTCDNETVKTRTVYDIADISNYSKSTITIDKSTLKFNPGVITPLDNDNKKVITPTKNEYLRKLDIVLQFGTTEKTIRIGIVSGTWGENQNKTETQSDDDCFPGNSKLILKDGTKKIFDEIEVGDEIQVCSKDMELSYSKVTFLPHLQNNKLTQYIKFVTESNQSIRATPTHYLPILNKNDVLENVFAEDITKEDKLYVLNNGQGMPEAIQSIETIQEKGAYTAYVKEGEYIVVDNVVSSPFGISYNATKNYSTFLSLVDNIGLLPYTSSFIRNGKKIVINILETFGLMSYFVSKNRH